MKRIFVYFVLINICLKCCIDSLEFFNNFQLSSANIGEFEVVIASWSRNKLLKLSFLRRSVFVAKF